MPADPRNPHIILTKAEKARKQAVAGFVQHALKDTCSGNQNIQELDPKTATLFNDEKLSSMNPWGLMSLDIFTGDSPTVAAYRVKKAKIEAERSRLILSKAKSIQASTHESLQKKASIMRGSSRHLSV